MIEKTSFGDPVGSTTSDTCINNCWEQKDNCSWFECLYTRNNTTNDIDYGKLVNAFYSEIVW